VSEREQKSGGAGCFFWGVVVFMLLVLYVLGLGPAVLLTKHYPAHDAWLVPIYFPLLLLGENCQPVEDVLTWYVKLWAG
jgi:hypothetical protein